MTNKELEERIKKFMPSLQVRSDEEIAAREAERRAREHKEWQARCGLDADYFSATIESPKFAPDTKAKLHDFIQKVKDGEAPFLINIGKVGTGKTYAAAAVMNALGFGTFLDMPELDLRLNTADRYGARETREDVMHQLAKCSLLVLDEIGRFPHRKQQEQEVLFYLINKRYQNRRPTIICSNLTGEEFAQHLGEALIDRIKSRRIRIDLNGQSLRSN
jgi:DNA replication protein DnaC